MAYNLENWLSMERQEGRGDQPSSKPEAEKKAVVSLIVNHRPDVLGVCEIGSKEDLSDLQARLKQAGWDMPHAYLAPDPSALRRLALLSRYPVVAQHQAETNAYRLNGRWRRMSRNLLDATIEAKGSHYRFVGVHLKSKREVHGADQEAIRFNEAGLVRRHATEILKQDPAARLVVYGDFNDTRRSNTMKKIAGAYGTPLYLTAVPLVDSRGDSWTHYWDYQDVYSRFDYALVSQRLKPEVDYAASYIADDPHWRQASDHRPLLMVLKSR